MKIERAWAMPSKNTFTIKPIAELLERYMNGSGFKVSVDPFANKSRIASVTNDLCPDYDTDYHLDALKFLKMMETKSADAVFYDPPYSITQAAQCYKSYGKERLETNVANMKYWADCKDEAARILKPKGLCFSFGWNSNGLGKKRGFEMIEMLVVAHGGSKNDTICTVERKNVVELDF